MKVQKLLNLFITNLISRNSTLLFWSALAFLAGLVCCSIDMFYVYYERSGLDATLFSLMETRDGGYFLTGSTTSDLLMAKYETNGNMSFAMKYDTSTYEALYGGIETSDGGYLAVGYTYGSGMSWKKGVIIKVDSQRNVQWVREFGCSVYTEKEDFSRVIETSDGYITVGETECGVNDKYALIVKFGFNGDHLWTRTIGCSDEGTSCEYEGTVITNTSDHNFVIGGYRKFTSKDLFLASIENTGTINWLKVYTGISDSLHTQDYIFLSNLKTTKDGGLIGSGQVENNLGNILHFGYVFKVNSQGVILWITLIKNNDRGFTVYGIEETFDGGVIAAGNAFSSGGPCHIGLVRISSNGEVLWNKRFNGPGHDYGYKIIKSSDSKNKDYDEEFILTGITRSYAAKWGPTIFKVKGNGDNCANEWSVSNNYYTLNYTNISIAVDFQSGDYEYDENFAGKFQLSFPTWNEVDITHEFTQTVFCRQCYDDFYDPETCSSCLEYRNNVSSSKFCSYRGNCTNGALGKCNCVDGYFGNCDVWKCGNVYTNETHASQLDQICTGHGECISPENCTCEEGYLGSVCQIWTCHNISATSESVCGGHGFCMGTDYCECRNNYFDDSEKYGVCGLYHCQDYEPDDYRGCNGHGNCIAYSQCLCSDDYEGDFCEDFSCFGFQTKNVVVCSGNGACKKPNECSCKTGYVGNTCSTNLLLIVTLVPSVTAFGFGIGIAFLIIACLICCSICCFLFWSFCFACCLACCFCCYSCTQKFQVERLSKLKKLKNFDILMKEQQLEEDTSVAHLRINKNLFEIKYEEINLVKVLGEGGSASVVYKAKWKGQVIAFKCFKTRSVCDSQDTFDEFEREVEILGSVSHPAILRFLGCCLSPPRVGILMEFCENGDLAVFLRGYAMEEGKSYPVEEKLRLCLEISGGMEYLHSRNIIHRDMKLENVLLDSKERPKIMDFGLSKLITRMSQSKTKSIGTSLYIAPELITSSHYDEKCDVFSFAVMMFIIFTEEYHPYGTETMNIELRVANSPELRPNKSELENCLPKTYHWLIDVIDSCWSHYASKRFSFSEITQIISRQKERIAKEIESSVNVEEQEHGKHKNTLIVLRDQNKRKSVVVWSNNNSSDSDSFSKQQSEGEGNGPSFSGLIQQLSEKEDENKELRTRVSYLEDKNIELMRAFEDVKSMNQILLKKSQEYSSSVPPVPSRHERKIMKGHHIQRKKRKAPPPPIPSKNQRGV